MAAELTGGFTAALPWAFVLGLFGLFFKARLSGDPALWKRVESLEAEIKAQRKEFDDKLDRERKECERRIVDLEGTIRQLQQRQKSATRFADKPLCGSLDIAFPPDAEEAEKDLLRKLDRIPSPKRPRRRK